MSRAGSCAPPTSKGDGLGAGPQGREPNARRTTCGGPHCVPESSSDRTTALPNCGPSPPQPTDRARGPKR
eukprot:10697027-Alexandrium_andersonii.AAC.1